MHQPDHDGLLAALERGGDLADRVAGLVHIDEQRILLVVPRLALVVEVHLCAVALVVKGEHRVDVVDDELLRRAVVEHNAIAAVLSAALLEENAQLTAAFRRALYPLTADLDLLDKPEAHEPLAQLFPRERPHAILRSDGDYSIGYLGRGDRGIRILEPFRLLRQEEIRLLLGLLLLHGGRGIYAAVVNDLSQNIRDVEKASRQSYVVRHVAVGDRAAVYRVDAVRQLVYKRFSVCNFLKLCHTVTPCCGNRHSVFTSILSHCAQ